MGVLQGDLAKHETSLQAVGEQLDGLWYDMLECVNKELGRCEST